MRFLLPGLTALADLWLGVAVRRDDNTDADLLSHPARAIEVTRRAAAAGLVVHELRLPPDAPEWQVLMAAAALGVGAGYGTDRGVKRAHGGDDADPGSGGGESRSGEAAGAAEAPRAQGRRLGLFEDDPFLTDRFEARGAGSVAVVVFSGEDARTDGLPHQLRLTGLDTVVVDTKEGGASHNVLLRATQRRIALWVHSGRVLFLFMGIPCESFSIAHRPQLRSARHADGLPSMPADAIAATSV